MTTAQFFIPYMVNFFILFVLNVLIKSRLKLLYPSIHSQVFARTISEHNIKVSIENLKFMLLHKNWQGISESTLLALLQIQRVSWLLMVSALIAFPLIALNGGFSV
jgi:hypothetical protein